MALPSVPDWLTKRGGELKPGINSGIVFIMLDGKPQYRLDVRPSGGQFGCAITQTVNGKRLDGNSTFPSAADALIGGLTTLREKLGW
jgi:hypothetical protein